MSEAGDMSNIPEGFDAEFIVRQLDPAAALEGVSRLGGGSSAFAVKVDYRSGSGALRSVVVRRHGERDGAANPRIARFESAVLRTVRTGGIPAPEPLEIVEFPDRPEESVLVQSTLEGAVDFGLDANPSAGEQMAELLTRIHAIDHRKARIRGIPNVTTLVRSYLRESSEGLDDPMDERESQSSLPWTTINKAVLLHGDFWPGNLLWQDGSISGIVDWEDACLGDPLKDVSNCRAELYLFEQEATVQSFTDAYLERHPRVDIWGLGFWDAFHASQKIDQIPQWGWSKGDADKAIKRLTRFQHMAVSR